MMDALRADFNRRFTHDQYAELLRALERHTSGPIPFQVAETPVFLPSGLVEQLVKDGAELTYQLVGNDAYLQAAIATIPPTFRVKGVDAHPNFMTADFALIREAGGELTPKLVELQAFPSLYGYQSILGEEYKRCFHLDASLQSLLGRSDEEYWALLRSVIVGQHDPENVILMEVAPEQQKTLPDFRVYEEKLGVRTVDVAAVRQQGRSLFYESKRRRIPIKRIFNRAIAEDLVRRSVQPGFEITGDLDVEWAGHPAWYFLISKFSLPYLQHRCVPPSVFLDRWLEGEGREQLPEDSDRLVLKPLFSFAGKGVVFAPSIEELRAIPVSERGNYLLQQRQDFVATIQTPHGLTQAEIRVLYVWPAGGQLTAVNTLVRLGRGQMMGVDHNRGQQWVGGSAGLLVNEASGFGTRAKRLQPW